MGVFKDIPLPQSNSTDYFFSEIGGLPKYTHFTIFPTYQQLIKLYYMENINNIFLFIFSDTRIQKKMLR